MSTRSPRAAWIAAALVLLCAAPALGKEESKIWLPLERVDPQVHPRTRAFVRVFLTEWQTVLHLHATHLDPSTEYIVTLDGEEFARFTTWQNGNANRLFNLLTDATDGEPTDPRGKLLAVNDGTTDLLAGVVSGPMEPRATRAKEWTQLQAEDDETTGVAFGRFHLRPNGFMTFAVIVRGVLRGDYEVFLDGDPIGTISTNPGGWGRLFFRGHPNDHGQGGNGRRPWETLTFDPRYKLIEVVHEGVLVFSGPMKAQIAGLNVCMSDQTQVMLSGPGGQGSLRFGTGEDCDDQVAIEVSMMVAGDYDVELNDVPTATLSVGMDGTGMVVFESHPEDGELPLTFALQPGDLVEVVDPMTLTTQLSTTVP